MSGRMLALMLTLALCCGLAAGCAAGLEAPPIFVTPPPATPGSAGPQAFPTAAAQALSLPILPGLVSERPQAASASPGQAPEPAIPPVISPTAATAASQALP